MKRREANRMDLIRRNENFVETLEQIDPDYFQNLSQGQHPHCFMLACSDSQVSPSVVTQAPLGTMFVHRNIANQVNSDDESLNAGLYYALTRLHVNKVIVKGPTGCGGIAAAADGLTDPERPAQCTGAGSPHRRTPDLQEIWTKYTCGGLPASPGDREAGVGHATSAPSHGPTRCARLERWDPACL